MRFLKKFYPLISAPVFTFGILIFVFAVYSMYPFGNGSVAWCDMNQQVIPLLMDFKDILCGKDGLFLNMHNAGGMNFYGVFCFFLSNPFSFIVLFVEKENMIYFVNILVILKLTLCSASASLYFCLCKRKLYGGIAIVLSIMYSLCGYGMLFYQNIMWLDIMYMFPVLMIGLERLINQRKNILYIISLSVIMIMNFYICYMIAVFILLYISLYMLTSPKNHNYSEVAVKFLSGMVISALMTSVIWLPCIIQISSSGRMKSLSATLSASDFLTNYTTVLPLLFCTAFIFPIILFYAFGSKKRDVEKRNNLIIFAFLLIPLFIEPVNLMWHTGNYMSFPARYGFITIFMGLVCCGDFFSGGDSDKIRIPAVKQGIVFVLLSAAVFLYYLFTSGYIDKNFGKLTEYTASLWGNSSSFDGLAELFVITVLCYALVYLCYRKRFLSKQIFSLLIAAVCVFESMGNIRIYMVSPAVNNPTRTETFADISKLGDKIDDNVFYRVVTDYKTADYNMSGALGYNSIGHYTSLTNHNFMYMQRLLGYSTVWMKSGSSGGTELTNIIFSSKYKISNGYTGKNPVYSANGFYIDELPYYSGLGIICDNDFNDCTDIPSNLTRAQIQQYIFAKIYNTDKQLIKEYDCDKTQGNGAEYVNGKYFIINGAEIKYNFYVSGKQSIYADCYDRFSNDLSEDYFDSLNIKVNNITVGRGYPGSDSNGLLWLGEFENEYITVEIEALKNIRCYIFGIFGMNLDVLTETINNDCANLNCGGGKIFGYVNTDEIKTCLLSVPFNEGLQIKINGEIIPCKRVLSDFTAFELKEGENNIEIQLIPKGFVAGVIITAIGLMLFIIYMLFGKKIKIHNIVVKAVEIIVIIISLGGVLMVYLFPMLMIVF